jgi:hypothetical protein
MQLIAAQEPFRICRKAEGRPAPGRIFIEPFHALQVFLFIPKPLQKSFILETFSRLSDARAAN